MTLTVLYLHAWPLLSSWFGIVFVLVGIVAGVWSMASLGRLSFSIHPVPGENAELRRTGAYRFVRHPMYTIVFMIGIAVAWMNPAILAFVSLICAAIVLFFKLKLEERLLTEKFPGYAEYASVTPSLLPFLRCCGSIRTGVFVALLVLGFVLLASRVVTR